MNSPGKPTKGTTNILLADSKGFYPAQNIHVLQETQILEVEKTDEELKCKTVRKLL